MTIPPVNVGISGTLTGNGAVRANGTNFFSSLAVVRGTLAPSGGLKIYGNLSLNSTATATTAFNVTPQAADSLFVSGTALLGGRLLVSMTGAFTPDTRYTLLQAAGGRGNDTQFASHSINYPTGQCFTPRIAYQGNDVNLYPDRSCEQ